VKLEELDAPTLRRLLQSPNMGEPTKERIRSLIDSAPDARPTDRPAPLTAKLVSGDGGVPVEGRSFVLYGVPRTKKNSLRRKMVGGQLKTVASEAWYAWVDALRATAQLPPPEPLPDHPYNCAAAFYRAAAVGDLVGYQQGLADVLEKLGVLSDDGLIQGWDGSRLLVDRACPRVEVTLTPIEEG
jgi:hypothetical protein